MAGEPYRDQCHDAVPNCHPRLPLPDRQQVRQQHNELARDANFRGRENCRASHGRSGDEPRRAWHKMPETPLTLRQIMTNINLGNAMGDVLFEDSPATAARVMANRAVVSSGLATMSTANAWMLAPGSAIKALAIFGASASRDRARRASRRSG